MHPLDEDDYGEVGGGPWDREVAILPILPILPNRSRKPLQLVPGVDRLLLVTMMVFPQAPMPRGDRKNNSFLDEL